MLPVLVAVNAQNYFVQVPDPSDADVQPVRVVSNGVVGGIGGSNVLGQHPRKPVKDMMNHTGL